jgi:pectate lyase
MVVAYCDMSNFSAITTQGLILFHLDQLYTSTYFTVTYAHHYFTNCWVRRGRGRMVVGFITTCAINACHHYSCEYGIK